MSKCYAFCYKRVTYHLHGHCLDAQTLLYLHTLGYYTRYSDGLPCLFFINDILYIYYGVLVKPFDCVSYCHKSHQQSKLQLSCYPTLAQQNKVYSVYGGGAKHSFSFETVSPHIISGDVSDGSEYSYIDHVASDGLLAYPVDRGYVHANIPLEDIIPYVPVKVAYQIA